MIDVHSHILPGIDDGPTTPDESLEMCRIAWDDGIRAVVATPHFADGRFAPEPERVRTLVADLNGVLTAHGIPLRVLPGMEAMVGPSLPEHLDGGRLLPLNDGKYVLMELYPGYFPTGFENLINRLIHRGYGLVLAHPEKNHFVQRRPDYLFHLIRRFKMWDVLVQITAESLLRPWMYLAYRTARTLLRHDLVHLIASDAHSVGRRPPRLLKAVEAAADLVGEQRALRMVHDVPLAVLGGKEFPDDWEPRLPPSKGFL